MSDSIDKPPYFNGAHYSHWKNRMMIFLQSIDYKIWDIIEDEPNVPMKRVGEVIDPKEKSPLPQLHELPKDDFLASPLPQLH
ncbi:hypothetical protein GQ457_08G032220 [Hibiscus cannabinus]